MSTPEKLKKIVLTVRGLPRAAPEAFPYLIASAVVPVGISLIGYLSRETMTSIGEFTRKLSSMS